VRLPSYQDLSKEQDEVLSVPLESDHLVVGPPGTGKTVMALHRTTALFEQGFDPRLLMFGRLLAGYTGTAARTQGVDDRVSTFHSWFYAWFRKATKREAPEANTWEPDWPAVQAMLAAVDWEGSVSHLLVDEGQDFSGEFYLFVRAVAGCLTIYADENQRITDHSSRLDEIQALTGIESVHRLTRNYRNTLEIAQVAASFYVGHSSGVPDPPARRGDRPVLHHHRTLAETAAAIRRWEAVNPDTSIGVIVPRNDHQKAVIRELKGRTVNPVQFYRRGKKGERPPVVDFAQPGIVVVNHASAKGLEFDSVFLPELQQVPLQDGGDDVKMLMYVLTSRARDHLFLAYSGDGRAAVIDHLPLDLLDVR
jgi:superfamily I DNA/RNA helicase